MGLFDSPLYKEYILEGKEHAALNGIVIAARKAEMQLEVLIQAILLGRGLFMPNKK